MLLANANRDRSLESEEATLLRLTFEGIAGDAHGGATRQSDSRMLRQYRRGTEVKNARQVSILSVEEMEAIARTMGIERIRPQWVGANFVTRGIPDLTLLPPSTRLQFPSGAMIVVDIENLPCRYPAAIIEKHYPSPAMGFVTAARHKRGVVGWVEAEGEVRTGDSITLWLPPQRTYSYA